MADIILTGATGGIGRALALELAAESGQAVRTVTDRLLAAPASSAAA
jgi:NAD(P)-dependent dehydrogenase (short-subunit alcohol dehydrogenase family)